jgi:hypothetical protein
MPISLRSKRALCGEQGTASTPPQRKRLRSDGRVTCCDFGRYRESFYSGQGFFFCSRCAIWDTEDPNNVRIKRTGRRACVANHTSFVFPTHLRINMKGRLFQPGNKDSKPDDGNDISDEEELSDRPPLIYTDDDSSGAESEELDDNVSRILFRTENSALDETTEDLHVEIHSIQDALNKLHDLNGAAINGCAYSNKLSTLVIMRAMALLNAKETNQQSDALELSTQRNTADNLLNQLKELQQQKDLLKNDNAKLILQRQSLKKENKTLKTYVHRLRTQASPATAFNEGSTKIEIEKGKNEKFRHNMESSINVVRKIHGKRWSRKRLGQQIAKTMWEYQDNVAQPYLLQLAKEWLRANVFTPFRILRTMDFAGGVLSYEAIEVLRKCETNGTKFYRGSVIPSSADLRRVAAAVERYGDQHCPFAVSSQEAGEAFRFNLHKTVPMILKAHGLDTAAKTRSVGVAESIDGAMISKNVNMVAAGMKITDTQARCPFTKRLLVDSDEGSSRTGGLQSRNNCFPLQVQIGSETKQSFLDFKEMFGFFDLCGSSSTNPLIGYQPLDVMVNCDLAATWRGTSKGGGMKVYAMPCHCCSVNDEEVVKPNEHLCPRWCQEVHDSDPNWQCYHRSMEDGQNLQEWMDELNEMKDLLTVELSDITSGTKIRYRKSENSNTNPKSIWYEPNSSRRVTSFNKLLTDELILRGLEFPLRSTWVQRRDLLLEALKREQLILDLIDRIEHCKTKEEAVFIVMKCIPCILHCENRVGLKLLTMLLVEGLSNAKKALLFAELPTEQKRIDCYISTVQAIINSEILGSNRSPAQWRVQLSEDGKEIGIICMDNTRMRKVVNKLEGIINISVVNPGRINKWNLSVEAYRKGMIELRRKSDFTPEEVPEVQKQLDIFFQNWMNLWGRAGITNYIHMLGCGHMADYLLTAKNLYRHSQQGWENLNHLLKTFFFRRTARGGASNKGTGTKDRLRPIARWMQRRLCFSCGLTQEELESIPEGDVLDLYDDVHA